jgi:hypothetical protein
MTDFFLDFRNFSKAKFLGQLKKKAILADFPKFAKAKILGQFFFCTSLEGSGVLLKVNCLYSGARALFSYEVKIRRALMRQRSSPTPSHDPPVFGGGCILLPATSPDMGNSSRADRVYQQI